MNYTLAHLSDFHFSDLDDDFDRGCALVDDSIDQGADHLVITGDIADAAQMEVVRGFIRYLKGREWAAADRLTVIPGNHDIFPISFGSMPVLRQPTSLFEDFVRATRGCCTGAERLVADGPYPFGKVLSPDVVMVGMDTTRNDEFNPLKWAEGELQEHHQAAVTDFFALHHKAKHRIVAMHHHPWDEEFVWWGTVLEQNFTTPPPEEVEAWLRECGATLVLCGHVHQAESIEKRRLGRRCLVLRSGTAGGINDEDDGDKLRVYHLIELSTNGRMKIIGREFWDSEFDTTES